MLSQEIRRAFLEFFQKKGHAIVPSSPVVPLGDPTLLFINAGMNQFKDVFLGKSLRSYTKAATAQKCIRVGGKHNDLENVGHTSRHLTFFEMLGNFSFGDYFKKIAIDYAWELALTVFGFPPEKLWATVFHEDEESFELWKAYLPEEKIIRMGEKDNFWAMGETGPCGPCSELYFDRGPSYSPARSPAEDVDGERYLEFWNLVFMEFNRTGEREMLRLPKQSVDTGSGLERVVALKMGVNSLFETDILREIIAGVERISGQIYQPNHPSSPPFRVIADHLRTLSFAIADGVQPSNLDRGYVLRKVLRRAVRYGRQLGMEKPFLTLLLPSLIAMMGDDYPELKRAESRIAEILHLEEENFLRTLKRGGNILGQIIDGAKISGKIAGEDAFKLKDTYGLPLEEILLLAKDTHLTVDIRKFEELELEARERSRGARKTTDQIAQESVYEKFLLKHGPAQFLGYEQLQSEGVVLGLMQDGQEVFALHEGETGVVLLDQTPFYAEKGGQVADQGVLSSDQATFEVLDCQSPFTDVIAHLGTLTKGELHLGDRVAAQVDPKRRQKIANNHTATHLLHWALKEILGTHVRQAGSIVEQGRLRFDFNHHKGVSGEELIQIENLVNEKIRENLAVHTYEMPYAEAQKNQDIVQFFGEKYGNLVRVVDVGCSQELCGGTHTQSCGSIGYFRILKEGSVAAGVRRIEAATAEEAAEFAREEKKSLHLLLEKAGEENRILQNEIVKLRRKLLTAEIEKIYQHRILIGPYPLLAHAAALDPEQTRECADLMMKKEKSLILLLIGTQEDKCSIIVRVTPDWVNQGIRAVDLLKEITSLLNGKGGGKADAAQGSGTQLDLIPEALKHAQIWLEQKII